MCGILGYIALDKKRPDLEKFKKSLIVCQNRGTDATGFFTPLTNVVKKDVKAEEFVKKFADPLAKGIHSDIMIAHCRAETQGTKKNNVNNHPHESENYVMVHNGCIGRSKPPKDYKMRSECDSEIILSYIETYGIKKGLEEMNTWDSMAIALWSKKEKLLYLFRNGNPTHLLIDKKDQIIYFASTTEILKPFYRYDNYFGFNLWENISAFETEKDKLYTFDLKSGLIKTEDIKQKTYTQSEYSGGGYTGYRGSHYQPVERKTYCNKCGKTVPLGNHQCDNANGFSSLTGKNFKRSIIYRGAQPRFIINEIKQNAA